MADYNLNKFQRQILFKPAFDKRDPNPHKNYGIGVMRIYFALIGERGAVVFDVGTGWYLPSVRLEYGSSARSLEPRPMSFGISLHYKKRPKSFLGQTDKCEWLGDKPCWYDVLTTIESDKLLDEFVENGEEVIWKRLEEIYSHYIK